jgi:hypothetical protein
MTVSKHRNSVNMKANEADRLLLKRMLRTNIFAADCTCPKCFTTGYCNYPYSCLIDHSRDELLVQPQKRPTLAPDIEGRFEEHTLAQAAIEYFSRPKSEMDAVQLEALENYHQLAAEVHLIDVLNSKDLRLQLIGSGPRPQLSEHSMQQLLSIFNELFFFGSLMDIHFSWSTKFDNWEKRNHHPYVARFLLELPSETMTANLITPSRCTLPTPQHPSRWNKRTSQRRKRDLVPYCMR